MGLFDVFKKGSAAQAPGAMPVRPHPLRGWTNMGVYEVRGVSPATGRQNKKRVEAVDEAGAIALSGLGAPVSAVEVQRPMASRGVKITERESQVDASALISMVQDGERPASRITPDQWAAACAAGVCVSALSCQKLYASMMREARNGKG